MSEKANTASVRGSKKMQHNFFFTLLGYHLHGDIRVQMRQSV